MCLSLLWGICATVATSVQNLWTLVPRGAALIRDHSVCQSLQSRFAPSKRVLVDKRSLCRLDYSKISQLQTSLRLRQTSTSGQATRVAASLRVFAPAIRWLLHLTLWRGTGSFRTGPSGAGGVAFREIANETFSVWSSSETEMKEEEFGPFVILH